MNDDSRREPRASRAALSNSRLLKNPFHRRVRRARRGVLLKFLGALGVLGGAIRLFQQPARTTLSAVTEGGVNGACRRASRSGRATPFALRASSRAARRHTPFTPLPQ